MFLIHEHTSKSLFPIVRIEEDSNGNKTSGSNSPMTEKSLSPCPSPSRHITEEFLQKDKIEASKEAALEAENKAAQVRKELPMEQRVEQFNEMLIEKKVSAYSTWEKELQKIGKLFIRAEMCNSFLVIEINYITNYILVM